jgi:hypothetical protein
MGIFDSKDDEKVAHEAAYDAGREASKSDSIVTNVVNGLASDLMGRSSDSERASHEQGYHDQSTGQNPKD